MIAMRDDHHPAPRPPGGFPRGIAHDETVEYSYNPETDEFQARIVDTSEPVVTRWDARPPDQAERPVGTYDVTPTNDGVHVEGADRDVAVPEAIQDELEFLARHDHTEDPVTLTAAVRYEHDLDTRATTIEIAPHKDAPEKRRRSPAELAAIIQRRNEQGPLDGRFKAAADALASQAEARRRQARQRPRSRDRDGQRRWTVPGIVVKVGGP